MQYLVPSGKFGRKEGSNGDDSALLPWNGQYMHSPRTDSEGFKQVGAQAFGHLLIVSRKNKYAIHAYTYGPVTGSGPSVKPLKYDVAPYWLS